MAGIKKTGGISVPFSAFELAADNDTRGGGRPRNNLGNSLVSLIVGAIVLWVGQTTFQHSGKLTGLEHQVKAMEDRHAATLLRYDEVLTVTAERTRSRFTREDGELLLARIKEGEQKQQEVNKQVSEWLSSTRARLAALDVQIQPQVSDPASVQLWSELRLLRSELSLVQRFVDAPAAAQRSADFGGNGFQNSTVAHPTAIGYSPRMRR